MDSVATAGRSKEHYYGQNGLKTLMNMPSTGTLMCVLTTNEPTAFHSTQCDSLWVTMGDQMTFKSKKTSWDAENNHDWLMENLWWDLILVLILWLLLLYIFFVFFLECQMLCRSHTSHFNLGTQNFHSFFIQMFFVLQIFLCILAFCAVLGNWKWSFGKLLPWWRCIKTQFAVLTGSFWFVTSECARLSPWVTWGHFRQWQTWPK